MEDVIPRRQLEILGVAAVAGFEPMRFMVFEPVFETHVVRRGKIQAGVTDLQSFRARRDGDALQPRAKGVGDLLPRFHQHGFNDDRRPVGVGRQIQRVHGHQAFRGREPEPAVMRQARGGLRALRTFARGQAVAFAKRAAGNEINFMRGKIVQRSFRHAHQSHVGTHPQITARVFDQVADAVAEQPGAFGIRGEFAVQQPSQARAVRADP